jgi:beta-glucanase (GH16 family)
MSPLSFCSGIATLLAILQASLVAAGLALQHPRDYQVFQRNSATQGTVLLFGVTEVDSDAWEYRFEGQDAAGRSLPGVWLRFPTPPLKGKFDFRATVPAGGWYKLEVRTLKQGRVTASAAVDHVGVGELFLVVGQSNSANHGSTPQRPETGMVSGFDGKTWAPAIDPQKGASGKGGSFLPSFGDAMARSFHVPIGVVPIGVGSTSIREWLPKGEKFPQQTTTGKGVLPSGDGHWVSDGILFDLLCSRLDALGPLGLRAVLWHQGESDAAQARGGAPGDRQISGGQYLGFLSTLVKASRKVAGWDLPWVSAQTTYHSETDPADEEFRAAQSRAWQEGLTVQGPDTDALRAGFRDGVHFNATGLRRHGELWASHIVPWLWRHLVEPPQEGPPSSDYHLVWNDEFDGSALDPKKWKHRYPGPRKNGFNDPSAVTLDGQGHLSLTCSRASDGRFLTGMICSEGLFAATYGYFEARVQLQTQEGWWPGFWLMTNQVGAPDKGSGRLNDTAKNGTEVDVFEYLRRHGAEIQHALHWNGYGKSHQSIGRHVPAPGLTEGFHTIGVQWTPDSYAFYVDGRKTWETERAISKTPEYLILSGEVSDWPGDIHRAQLPDRVVFDYVRVWQKTEGEEDWR